MGWRESVVGLFFPGLIESAVAEAVPATGDTVDPDDDVYRRLTGGTRSLTMIEQDRAQAIALYLWRKNPMARRMTEMLADFVVGDGITFEAEDPDVQEVLDEFWRDPKMNLHLRHRDLVRDQSIYGEQAWEAVVNPTSGRVRLRFIDPGYIKDVRPNPDNALEDAAIVLKPPTGQTQDRVIEHVTFDDETDPKAPAWSGSGIYLPVNRVTGQHRGTPDLLAIADFVDGYDQLLFNALERSGLINAFVWDVTLTGSTQPQVDAWVQAHGDAPPPGAVRAHNEKEAWAAVAPDLGNTDLMALGRPVKNMALGGFGAPEAWFAEGDSANRATLAAQGDPTYRMITARQTVVGAGWTFIFNFVVAKAIEAGRLPINVKRDLKVILAEPSTTDTTALATALAQLAQSLAAAEEQDWISKESARTVFLTVLSGLGIEVDAHEEQEKIDGEAEDAAQKAEDAGLPAPGTVQPPQPPIPPQGGQMQPFGPQVAGPENGRVPAGSGFGR